MIKLSGKYLMTDHRAYALVFPETSEGNETEKFGYAPKLADFLLSLRGWIKADADKEHLAALTDADPSANLARLRTDDEINATIQALLDPMIDVWGCKLVEAQHRVVRAAAWLLPLDELAPYYEGAATDEIEIREWIEWNVRDCGIKHVLLDAMIEYNRDLDAPGLLAQIHAQIDEDCD